jgi:hypothetical protein
LIRFIKFCCKFLSSRQGHRLMSPGQICLRMNTNVAQNACFELNVFRSYRE